MDADVDAIDIDDSDDDDAGIFSIANDYHSEDEYALTDEEKNLSAVRTKRTAVNKDESAEEFLLAREAVVRFVQDSIADAIDKQKRNADKHGRANVLSFNIGDLVLLSTVNLPKHAVTNVGSSKLLPKYIGRFRVLRRMGNAYTIELPRRMRTHPTFYFGRLRPYYQYEAVSRREEDLRVRGSRPPSTGPVLSNQSGRQAKQPAHAAEQCPDELQSARHEENESNVRYQVVSRQHSHDRLNDRATTGCNCPQRGPKAHGVESARTPHHRVTRKSRDAALECQTDPTLELDQVFPPPPHHLVDSHGGQRFLVERILNHRDVNGERTSYLVRWQGYPPSWDSWEPRAQLMADVQGLVEQYDETHPQVQKTGRRKTTGPSANKGIARGQSLRPSQRRCAPSTRGD